MRITKSELSSLSHVISFDSIICQSASVVQKYFSLSFPNINHGHGEYTITYVNYGEGNRIYLKMSYNMTYQKSDFIEKFVDVFSVLTKLDLKFVAEKIWCISQSHSEAYRKYEKIDFDDVPAQYWAVRMKTKKCTISELPEGDIAPKDIFISKTYAVANNIVFELEIGSLKLKKGTIINSGKILCSVDPTYDCQYLKSLGFQYDDPKNMGGWIVPTSKISRAMQIRRSVSKDVQLYKYISERIDECP